jgi:hypothetical protein
MKQTRRTFLTSSAPFLLAAGCAAAWAGTAGGQQQEPRGRPQPTQPPDFNVGGPPILDPKLILEADQKEIKKDCAELLKLAQELQKEVATTDSSKVLSLPLIEKAGKIEKLAKHIQSLARTF